MITLREHKRFLAKRAVPGSALRPAHAAARNVVHGFLSNIDFSALERVKTAENFRKWLDCQTINLVGNEGNADLTWGRARKAINLFLRDCLYDYLLREKLEHVAAFLEIPLDSFVARGLRHNCRDEDLPVWQSIVGLTVDDSDSFQIAALTLAEENGLNRVDLDVLFWGVNVNHGHGVLLNELRLG